MTFEKKCSIETSDILAVQYECDTCRAVVSVPIEKLVPNTAASFVADCSFCGANSGFQKGANETRAFLDFNEMLRQITGIMKSRNIKLKLDIKCAD
jgi:hypothetical protein